MLSKLIHQSKYTGYAFMALAVLASIALNSCKKNNLSVDVSALKAPDAVAFVPATGVTTVSYFVKSTSDPYIIPVGITNVSNVDRTVQLVYSSYKAVAGTQYNAPTSVTFKAGAATDSITFKGLFAGYAGGRKDTVKIKFSGMNTVLGKDSFQLIIQAYCDVISANLIGNYANSTDKFTSGTATTKPNYTAIVSAWTPISSTSASIKLQNIGATPDVGWGYASANGGFSSTDPVITPGLSATLDWTNPANFTVTVPLQNYFNDGTGMSTITATGSFSSCDNTLTLTCKVKYAGDGNTYTHVTYLRR